MVIEADVENKSLAISQDQLPFSPPGKDSNGRKYQNRTGLYRISAVSLAACFALSRAEKSFMLQAILTGTAITSFVTAMYFQDHEEEIKSLCHRARLLRDSFENPFEDISKNHIANALQIIMSELSLE